MIATLAKLSLDIAGFIKSWLSDKDSFESRSFYGESFSLCLLSKTGVLDAVTREKLIRAYEAIDKEDPEFHWEFNNYALMNYLRMTQDDEVKRFLNPLRFKNTPCTNWTLLRSNARLLASEDVDLAVKEAKHKIKKYQFRSGLILDDPGVKSFQYHCFSMAMIAEIYQQTGDKFFLNSFLKGVQFIRSFILSNGDSLYVGRGQNQTFGYGALIYMLSVAFKYTNDDTILGDIKSVYEFLISFQRKDGGFPLVMNRDEKEIPRQTDIKDTCFPGWYPYNNYFDYLPFMGFFIARASEILREANAAKITRDEQRSYRDRDFVKIAMPEYGAVVSRTGGYWTNDLPIPYIVYRKQSLTPCYGGEQFQASLYNLKGLPIPYSLKLNKSLRFKRLSISVILKNALIIFSLLGVMIRRYQFYKKEVVISTKIFSVLKLSHLYLFKEGIRQVDDFSLEDNLFKVKSDKKVVFDSIQYSACGKLKLFVTNGNNSKLIFVLK